MEALNASKHVLLQTVFSKVHVQYYFDTYAPVSDYTTARLLIAIVAVK